MKRKSPNQSAFFILRALAGVLFCFVGVALAFFALRSATAQGTAQPNVVKGEYQGLAPVVRFDVSPPLRNIPLEPFYQGALRPNEDRDIRPWQYIPGKTRFVPEADPVVQSWWSGIEVPGPIVSFDGPPNVSGVNPPDPNGEVGPNHVVVMSNLSTQIFNKNGVSLLGPFLNNTFWAGFGGPCQTQNAGDPIVLYDQLADRWLVSQFTGTAVGGQFFNCVAISTGSDPTGSYTRYAISSGANFPDYPKYGIWPDAYFISTREFAGSSFAGVGAYALNRAQALAGNPAAQVIKFLVPPGATPFNVGDGLLPSDLDGTTLPPANSPNFYVGSMDNNGPYGAPQDALTLWKFVVDFGTPANSSFTLTNTIPVAPFNSILGTCVGRQCIPQPNTAIRIDHLGYRQRPLHRLAYRNFGTHESLVTNQSVSGGLGPNGEVSGIRWWEVRNPNVTPVIHQQGTYSPGVTDGIHRWMGSMAMDSAGNIALGYSASNNINPSVFPSVFYTGRAAFDPAGTLPRGEGSIINGTGSQTGGGNRWGDYTALSVDPTDDLTFWFVNEYLPTTSSAGWRLRIGSFRLSTAPVANSAVSIKTHGGAGTFPVNLPIVPVTGAIGIEPRRGPIAGEYQMVVAFPTAVTVDSAAVTTGTGAATFSVSGNEVTVNLTGVSDVQRIAVTLSNVNDGTNFGNVVIPMGLLNGDTNQSGGVTATDIGQTKAAAAAGTVDGGTFLTDVNVNGTINASDIGTVKARSGNNLP